MGSSRPLRLLRQHQGTFTLVDMRHTHVNSFDIISHRWYPAEDIAYGHGIGGLDWAIRISREKITHIKDFMIAADVEYLWLDCICIRQDNEEEKAGEVPKMFEYYKSAKTCHILMRMPAVWDPKEMVHELKFVDHVMYHMGGSSLSSEAPNLSKATVDRLKHWAEAPWRFSIPEATATSAALDLGVLNCYATCVRNVILLFANEYFTRVWTFQEMILGKNVTLWAIDGDSVSGIGELDVWLDLATDACDRALKLLKWINDSRKLKSVSVLVVMRAIEEDIVLLESLRLTVKGLEGARTDIISGGPRWWHDNPKGISNIFSAISIIPRSCFEKHDLFRGLLGIFDGLFTTEELQRDLTGEDVETMSFNFFKQLSIKTGDAWTSLAVSSQERGEYDWIPMVKKHSRTTTADCFAGVLKLGDVNKKGLAKTIAKINLKGAPRKFASIKLLESEPGSGFQFTFKGCNCGKKVKIGMIKRELVPTYDQIEEVKTDETAQKLVYCATVLGKLMDPSGDVVAYRRKLLRRLLPNWRVSDPNAKPAQWEDRCVSGTMWEDPRGVWVHNWSFSYRMVDLEDFRCQLATETTAGVSCKVEVNCGCTFTAPFSFIFQGLTAVYGSSLGDKAADFGPDNRITLQDGLGLVQVGDVNKTFNLVAFDGDISAYKIHASQCRKKRLDPSKAPDFPRGRALVSEEFSHGLMDQMRNYGYVDTGGSGNLLICRNHLADPYKIIGACIDKKFEAKKEGIKLKDVKIR
ncbi:uncharacterized protein M421DRAFT_72285 [Didymella exigua CBS 183.55]|uniref:Heterokaryon incompatibility domain-containing protein n=1 Tax=Didymella exigua CBS 183.55 TaxID=1150837 RepID=A0A6A5RFI7_9PLEO|nr:uncharacterized protein M421DRAFT_72285 [Didymella exigua CBS 183.55]KAF1924437.1 hypothetical protein M421DRAFT_72285 [Didymella exigua CBS 183.55]